jgi:hypothetical protein
LFPLCIVASFPFAPNHCTSPPFTSFLSLHLLTYPSLPQQFRNEKIIYRRYAGLFFCLCVDNNDNELGYLEAIHLFVEVLDAFFQNVCELDLVFSFYKVSTGSGVVEVPTEGLVRG